MPHRGDTGNDNGNDTSGDESDRARSGRPRRSNTMAVPAQHLAAYGRGHARIRAAYLNAQRAWDELSFIMAPESEPTGFQPADDPTAPGGRLAPGWSWAQANGIAWTTNVIDQV